MRTEFGDEFAKVFHGNSGQFDDFIRWFQTRAVSRGFRRELANDHPATPFPQLDPEAGFVFMTQIEIVISRQFAHRFGADRSILRDMHRGQSLNARQIFQPVFAPRPIGIDHSEVAREGNVRSTQCVGAGQ